MASTQAAVSGDWTAVLSQVLEAPRVGHAGGPAPAQDRATLVGQRDVVYTPQGEGPMVVVVAPSLGPGIGLGGWADGNTGPRGVRVGLEGAGLASVAQSAVPGAGVARRPSPWTMAPGELLGGQPAQDGGGSPGHRGAAAETPSATREEDPSRAEAGSCARAGSGEGKENKEDRKRASNRKAQRNFRLRQKNKILLLEASVRGLKASVESMELKITEAQNENLLMKSMLRDQRCGCVRIAQFPKWGYEHTSDTASIWRLHDAGSGAAVCMQEVNIPGLQNPQGGVLKL